MIEVAMQVEVALLDSQLQRYAEARTAERRAFQAWDGLIRELDRALRDSSSSIRELRDLEQRATLARETALTRARQVTDLRASLIDRMERIAVLEERLAREGRTRLVPVTPVDGLWRVAVEPIGVSGLARLRADGALVSGTYRMENGSQGSVTGTYAAGRLVLERIDVRQGFDATLEGDLDVRRGVVRGTWRSVDVTGGAISGGTWTATKLSPEERRQVESELDE
ncbi:MAG: hypothetical protein R3325_07775 [Thermoanaerobaculia bacterium]|nr:hypothetical protein [Thermoanaerobaculia bacterium]